LHARSIVLNSSLDPLILRPLHQLRELQFVSLKLVIPLQQLFSLSQKAVG
jgi:hypothetical protein